MRLSFKLRDQIFERDGHACIICGSSQDLEISHVVPRASGGSDGAENLTTLCRACNRAIGSRAVHDDFEFTLLELLTAHPDFRDVRSHVVVHTTDGMRRNVDIVGLHRRGSQWEPVWIECKLGGLTLPRIAEVRESMISLRGDAKVVLALASDLAEEHLDLLRRDTFDVWTLSDIVRQFGPFLPSGLDSRTAHVIRARTNASPTSRTEETLLRDLKNCERGRSAWALYQQLVGRLLTHLFCPPLQTPTAESADATKENRRDYVFPNYAEAGFWRFLREQYQADFIVVDAKNYAAGVKKRDVLQVAHYLKPHGAGLFAMIVSRTAPQRDARSAAREAWISQRKLILLLDDTDVESMVLAKVASEGAELLVRQKVEDFRLSL